MLGTSRSGTIRPDLGKVLSRSTDATIRRTIKSAYTGESVAMYVRMDSRSWTDSGDQMIGVTDRDAA
jgi:hypothetical protein